MAVRWNADVIGQSFCSWRVSAFEPAMSRGSALAILNGRRARCGYPERGATRFNYPPAGRRRCDAGLPRAPLSHFEGDHIFIRNIAPYRPFKRGDGVSSVVRCAMNWAGIVSPAKGAHVLRHTAATQMLRHGVPLDQIGLVLRHRDIDTTTYYAKADVDLLKHIAQPWPEVLS